MKFITAKGHTMSRFSLGTVQLGRVYGLGEDNSVPSEEKAFQILDRAMELGVDSLDTANNYGTSEEVIGRWLAKRRAEGKSLPWIVTKIGPFDHSSLDALREDLLRQTDACRKILGLETIDCLMLHSFDDYAANPAEMRRFLQQMKAEGVCNYTAQSVYSHHDYGVIAESGFDAIQIPLNVFDWSQIENGGIEKLHQADMMVFVRSVFLQGLVFKTPETVDPRMDFAIPYLKKFLDFCQEYNLSPAVAALSFVLSVPGITAAVLGCDNVEQVEANCSLFDQTVQFSQSQMDQLREAFTGIDPRVINPGRWFNAF